MGGNFTLYFNHCPQGENSFTSQFSLLPCTLNEHLILLTTQASECGPLGEGCREAHHSLASITGPMSKMNRSAVVKIYQEEIQKLYENPTS